MNSWTEKKSLLILIVLAVSLALAGCTFTSERVIAPKDTIAKTDIHVKSKIVDTLPNGSD